MKTISTTRKFYLTLLIFSFPFLLIAQPTAKQFYKAAMKAKDAGQFNEVIDNLTKAINLKPDDAVYYKERISAFQKLNKYSDAANDYQKLISLEKKEENYFNAGQCYLKLSNYAEARNMFNSALLLDKKYVEAYQQNALTKMYLHDFSEAIKDCDMAINYDSDNFLTYYHKAMAYDSLGNYLFATDNYKKTVDLAKTGRTSSLVEKPDLKKYYTSLGTAHRNAGSLDDAIFYYSFVFSNYDRNDAHVYYLRGIAYFKKADFQNALNDFNKSIFISDKNPDVFYQRGIVNKRLNNFQNAIDDFTKALSVNPADVSCLQARGNCYEEANKFEEAIRDYEQVLKQDTENKDVQNNLTSAKQKLFEKNRETIPPVIILTIPEPDDNGKIQIPENKNVFSFKGKIKDDNLIKSIKVNSTEAVFDKNVLNPVFTVDVPVLNADKITVQSADVYDNQSSASFTIFRTESGKPAIVLTTPFATPDNEIFIDNDKPVLFIEGKIKDESIIQSIIVEGIAASFELNKLNPVFSISINVSAKDTITVTASDKFSNTSVIKYTVKRESAVSVEANPMGRTWAVFIENSNYKNLQSLEGPANDVTLMKSTLVNYRVDKVLHKKDLTKQELEKFFSIELRDQVRNNNVRSVLVWFAGHGRFMNETGYWIPVDGVRDDESSLFNLNTLRAYMQSYNVVHTLVVSDACESGPAFYVAMRDIPEDKRCDDWNNTKFRSAQVLTSSNAETASDQSVFTQTFARTLNNNPESCIPIEKIAVKVTDAVKQNQKQYPKFGKINGLTDENGTFFFIKK